MKYILCAYYLTEKQRSLIEKLSYTQKKFDRSRNKSVIVREAIDQYFTNIKPK